MSLSILVLTLKSPESVRTPVIAENITSVRPAVDAHGTETGSLVRFVNNDLLLVTETTGTITELLASISHNYVES